MVVVFFSLSRSKLPGYVAPALPALSLLVEVRCMGEPTSREQAENTQQEDARQENLGSSWPALTKWEMALIRLVGWLLSVICLSLGLLVWAWAKQPTATLWGKVIATHTVEVVTLFTPMMLALGVVLLIGSPLIVFQRRKSRRDLRVALLMNASAAMLFVHLGLPVWSNYNIAPLHNLGRRALPALERGDSLVIYALKSGRTSLRFVLGHTPQITETAQSTKLLRIVQQTGHGYIWTTRKMSLPALPVPLTLHQEAATAEWMLWSYGKPPQVAAGEVSEVTEKLHKDQNLPPRI